MRTSLTSFREMMGVGYRRGRLFVEPSLGSIPKLAPVSFVTWVGGSFFGGLRLLLRPRDSDGVSHLLRSLNLPGDVCSQVPRVLPYTLHGI